MVNSVYPARGVWRQGDAREAGFDPDVLQQAVDFAQRAETTWPRDLSQGLNADPTSREPPPWNEVIGPTIDRGGPNGMVIRHGVEIARWGDTKRVDMTFSIAKSYLAILAGLALTEGRIRHLDDRVADYALDDGFASAQNRDITWRHFLHQSSEWEGELWGKPDLIDRNRQVGIGADNSAKGTHRALGPPGSFYEYNDVRVNRFSLALLHVFREPLPNVLATRVMQPIGASDNWQWHPYRNSWVDIDGEQMPSVPGGSHWGGGIFISSEDHARFALMVCRGGRWGSQQIVSESFIQELARPSPTNASYGFLWWLNPKRMRYSQAPESSIFALGAGSNLLWVDPQLDLVCVVRWIEHAKFNEFVGRLMSALR